ncbi:MAG: virulence factor MviN [Rhodoferax sp.]|nr:virulence factor MviN [Actinomycetota bacterium]
MSARRTVPSLAGAAGLIAVLTLLSRVVGFGRWFVFAAAVGSTCTGTAYQAANTVPNVLFEVVAGGALAACVVPLLSGPLLSAGAVAGDRAVADRTASGLLTWAVLALVPLAVLLALLAGPVAGLLSGAGCPGQSAQTARMLVVFAPQVALYGVGVVLSGVLQAHRRFVAPALAPLLSSLVVIGAYAGYGNLAQGRQGTDWVPGRGTELVLSLGTTLGVAVLSLPLLVPTRRAGVRLRPTLRLPPGVAARARRLALAGLAGLVAQQVVVLTALLLTTRRGAGTINVYTYVQAVYLLPYAVLAVPIATAAFPQLSERAAAADAAGYAATLSRSTRLVVLAAAAGAVVLIAAAPAVGQVFTAVDASRAGGPGAAALGGFAAALTAFAPGLVGLALIAHLGRGLFAAGWVRWAAVSTAGGWLLAAALSVVLVGAFADGAAATLLALGLASSVGMTAAGAALLVGAGRLRVGAVRPDGVLLGVPRALAAALVAGSVAAAAGRWVTDALLTGGVPAALLAGAAGAAAAAALLTAGWALAGGEDLRALAHRRPVSR